MTATRSATQPEPPHPTRPLGALPRGYARLVQRLGHGRWFAVALRQLGGARLDAALYRRTGGRLSIAGPALFPVLLLTTIGRRTGRPRTTPLIYVRDRERLVVSSESFGQTRAAAWPLNLAADPRVTVQLGAACSTFHARPATDEEAERLWPRLVGAWPAHETYRRRSGMRQVFVLEPADPAA